MLRAAVSVQWVCSLLFVLVSSASGQSFVNPFDPAWVDVTHDVEPHTIYAYVWPESVAPGDTLSIYVSSVSPTVGIRFQKVGASNSYVYDSTGHHHTEVPAGVQPVLSDPGTNTGVWSMGCSNWTPTLQIVVPSNWGSAPYYVEIWPEDGEESRFRQWVPFVVREPNPGANSIAVVLPTSTWWVYEGWGGKSGYDTVNWDRSNVLSRQRPFVNNAGRGTFGFRDLIWARFLAESGVHVDYLTMEDLHTGGRSVLDPYHVVMFVGHAEYWSDEERNAVEAYVDNGGNVFFASGNICWWRIEYSPDMKQVICFKGNNISDAAGGNRGIQPGQQYIYQPTGPNPLHPGTYLWKDLDPPNPCYSMVGAEFSDAPYGSADIDGHGTKSDWTVRDPSCFAFHGLGLTQGSKLGAHWLANDELNGLPLTWQGDPNSGTGVPVIQPVAYQKGLSTFMHVVATCEADPVGLSYQLQPRWGIMGWFREPGKGIVFSYCERNAAFELKDPNSGFENETIQRIVLNVINYLDTGTELAVPDELTPSPPVREYPNPLVTRAGQAASFAIRLDSDSQVALDVFSPAGEMVYHRSDMLSAGDALVSWRPALAEPSGVYYWRVKTPQGNRTGHLLVLR